MAKTPQPKTWSLTTQPDGRVYSNPSQYVPVPVPAAPTLVSTTTNSVTLNAVSPGSPAATMHVYRGGVKLTAGIGVAFGNYTDTTVAAGQTYVYTVAAVSGGGVLSSQSTGLTALTPVQVIGGLADGELYAVAGSGFGTKPLSAPIAWDRCLGASPAEIWTENVFPSTLSSTIAATPIAAGAYRATPFTRPIGTAATPINHPHSRGTKIFGGCPLGSDSYYAYNVGLSKTYSRPAGAYGLVARWWERVDPQWDESRGAIGQITGTITSGSAVVTSVTDPSGLLGTSVGASAYYINSPHFPRGTRVIASNSGAGTMTLSAVAISSNTPGASINLSSGNYKFFSHGAGWYTGVSEWYIDYQARVDLTAPNLETNDAAGGSLTPNHEWGSAGANIKNGWVLRTIYVRFDSSPNGKIHYYEGDSLTPLLSATTQVLDNNAGATRSVVIGTYQQANSDPNLWRYFADIYVDAGEDQFFLTNNANWSQSTIRELQPWTSWSDTSCMLACYGGRLPPGTAHLHFRRAPWQTTGHQYLGTRTIA